MSLKLTAQSVGLSSLLLACVLLLFVILNKEWEKKKRLRRVLYSPYPTKNEHHAIEDDKHANPANDYLHNLDIPRIYHVLSGLPILGGYLEQIYRHLTIISPKPSTEQKAIALKYWFLGISYFFTFMLVFCELMPNWSSKFGACILAYWLFIQGIEFFLVRQQLFLLKDLVSFIGDVRSYYFDTWMVEDSLHLALQGVKAHKRTGMLSQGGLLLEMLESPNDELALDTYNAQAPNHYLKLLACMLYVTREYGDAPSGQASRFAKSLNLLLQEIREEVLWREQLSFALKSLNVVIVMPLFVLVPIRAWASESFDVMNSFYAGPLGFLCENFVMCTVLLSTYLLREIHHNDGDFRLDHAKSATSVEADAPLFIFKIIDRLSPKVKSRSESRSRSKDIVSRLEWWKTLHEGRQKLIFEFLDKIKAAVAGLIIYCTIVVYALAFHPRIELQSSFDVGQELIGPWLNWALCGGVFTFVICWFSVIGYRWFIAYLSQLATQSEVNRYHTVILTIMHVPQLGIDGILHWLEKFAKTYRNALQKAILDFDAGGLKALDRLMKDSQNPDFSKIVTQLMMAVESLPIPKAFEELEAEKAYFQEKRRLEQIRFVQKKINLGQIVGFVPTYATLIVYFMLPMIYASISEMQRYIEVLK